MYTIIVKTQRLKDNKDGECGNYKGIITILRPDSDMASLSFDFFIYQDQNGIPERTEVFLNEKIFLGLGMKGDEKDIETQMIPWSDQQKAVFIAIGNPIGKTVQLALNLKAEEEFGSESTFEPSGSVMENVLDELLKNSGLK